MFRFVYFIFKVAFLLLVCNVPNSPTGGKCLNQLVFQHEQLTSDLKPSRTSNT